jgi:acyl carrier protein
MTPSQTSSDTVQTRLTRIFRTTLDDPTLVLRDDMTAADVEGWDSLTHIALIVAIERSFHIKFTLAEISRLSDVGALIKLINQKVRQP